MCERQVKEFDLILRALVSALAFHQKMGCAMFFRMATLLKDEELKGRRPAKGTG